MRPNRFIMFVVAVALPAFPSQTARGKSPLPPGQARAGSGNGKATGAFTLSCGVFKSGGEIPNRFTCDGADESPALVWKDPPAGTQSFALIADDPDAPAGTWVHWVIFDIPASVRSLFEAVPKADQVAGAARQGTNDFGRVGYGGPCPPPGKPHRYFFKLYALDSKLNLRAKASRKEVEQAMRGHILAQAELMGLYRR